MNRKQRTRLRRRLLQERTRASQDLDEFLAEAEVPMVEESGEYHTHLADQGTDTFRRELGSSLANHQSGSIQQIDDALRRLNEQPERSGVCELCGADIGGERLEVVPWATTCARCAEARANA